MPLFHFVKETFSQLIEAVAIQKMPLQASQKSVRYWFQAVKAFTSFDHLNKGVIELLFEYCTENL